jgi:hypothetical protein
MSGDALTFLQSVSGFVQAQRASSADRPALIGVVDATYDPMVNYPAAPPLPKVTVEGEPTLSGKQYAVLNGYLPEPGDRALMLPVGTTYILVGKVTNPSFQGFGRKDGTSDWVVEFGAGNDIGSASGMRLSVALTSSAIVTSAFPRAKLRRVANQSIGASTWTAVSWDTSDKLRTATWLLGTNPTRLTFTQAGAYLVRASVEWGSSATGVRSIGLRLNGGPGQLVPCRTPAAGQPISVGTAATIDVVAGDYLEVMVWQDSGGALNITNNGFGDGDGGYLFVDYQGAT